jgi:glycyl-tRNA synthetase
MYVQDVLQTLNRFWTERGCILWQPYHTEVGAGTSNPATFLRVLGPEPWSVAYTEPSIRPADGRYGENPNRLQHYFQYQVILKPSPTNVQELFLQSLEALGLDLTKHDFRFVEDNWQSPSLGAWGLGWEAWLDGMEITQFTYFQECGGVKLDVRACELTYGIERICMYLQGVESVYDLKWAPSGITYGDVYHASEVEFCKYNFEAADAAKLLQVFDLWETEGKRLLDEGLILPAYDHCLKLSHCFNLLDARGALSVAERGRFLLRCRSIAERCAKGFFAQRKEMGFPLTKLPRLLQDSPAPNDKVDRAAFKAKDTLLLEIGVEELPHNDVKTVLAQVPQLAEQLFTEFGLAHGGLDYFVTPRRIAIVAKDVPAKQADTSKEARGPKKGAAQNDKGEWTTPAIKFAEANGATVNDIYFQVQGKDEYCFVKAESKGKHITELVGPLVDKLIRGFRFGKSMGWEDSTFVFSRPIRWLVALHGSQLIPFSWALREDSEIGPARYLYSGRTTFGHRRLGETKITLNAATEYRERLRKGFVLVDRDERMQALRGKVDALCAQLGLSAEIDEDLFDEICDLVEWPEPIVAEIPKDALVLPEDIIITPMKVHQRYIPIREKNGKLSHHFLCVANGEHTKEGQQIIRGGNERVLNARLRDARYFWDSDTKTSLRDFAKKLNTIMFHQKLGTVADKVARIKNLYQRIKGALPSVDETAFAELLDLMKADLCTQMVFEFDSLEGVVGMLYAEKESLPVAISNAIFEHRLPRNAGDKLPESNLGAIAGILDRLDTLAGYFGIGQRVKGTSDPFGLRRNALALLTVLRAKNIDVDLESMLCAAIENYGATVEDPALTLKDVLSFFSDRLSVLSKDEGAPYDRVAAVIAAHAARPVRFKRCLDAVVALPEDEIQNYAEQTKRIQRIAKEPAKSIDPMLLDETEKPVYSIATDGPTRLNDLIAKNDFPTALSQLTIWMPTIANYFEATLVNHTDTAIRQNRHALLQTVLTTIRIVADFTQIEKRVA